jgi:hypothetical protein
MVFIGMPGIEKRLSRYPQLYSRVGFVHVFHPLTAAQVRELLHQKWLPSGVMLPEEGVTDEEALAAIIRVIWKVTHNPTMLPSGRGDSGALEPCGETESRG